MPDEGEICFRQKRGYGYERWDLNLECLGEQLELGACSVNEYARSKKNGYSFHF